LIADGRFYLQTLISALDHGLASRPGSDFSSYYRNEEWGYSKTHGFNAVGLEDIGVPHAFAAKANHADLEAFLARQVNWFFDQTGDFVSVAQRIDLSEFEAQQ
jgi:hypothetical protein